ASTATPGHAVDRALRQADRCGDEVVRVHGVAPLHEATAWRASNQTFSFGGGLTTVSSSMPASSNGQFEWLACELRMPRCATTTCLHSTSSKPSRPRRGT